ncbi:MAG: DUF1571 domain-containing protein [Planctomycetes bacterium]|nr:DUF1571 domain-containing protein [Planctomycetota bacterium]
MTCSKHRRCKGVAVKRRNLLAFVIAAAAVGLFYLHFDAMPAGGDLTDDVANLAAITEEIELPSNSGSNGRGSREDVSGPRADNSLQGKTALLVNMMLLERGIKQIEKTGSYTATFYKRERVNGRMLDAQVMKLKVRHKPFSVYMKWLVGDKGRELLYVNGQNKGKMLVKLGGVKGRLLPTMKLNPSGSMALRESRHPVTEVGILFLAKSIVKYRQNDLADKNPPQCRMFDNQLINGRKCYCFIVEYANGKANKEYRKSVIFIDKETFLPICVKNFTWPDSPADAAASEKIVDSSTLIEDYRYSNIRLNQQLTASDFDRKNSQYGMRR